ncbi:MULTISPECIES: PQQ-binding-like beta-propeller repeat protein [Haloarcula]|uniref:outer membrane protein assembly factor BamB family protein n=1 Tax=Haloarcula TaxID=2237 RepID=UPI0023E77C49|nr:PQQ-binding-like beta-propeller repeat protein [Halomicroarcula sp. SHR3]
MDRRTVLATVTTATLGGCLNLRSGESTPTSGRDNSTETVDETTSKSTPTVGAIDNELSLESSWARSFPSERYLFVDGDRLYTPVRGSGDRADGIRAVALESGATLWTAALGTSPNFMYATVANNRLYLTANQTLYAVETTDGRIAEQRSLGNTRGPPAVVDGTVVVGTTFEEKNTLYGLDAETFAERWRVGNRLELGDGRYVPSGFDGAVAAGGRVVAAYWNGRLSAYDPTNGTELWRTQFVTAGPKYGPFPDGVGRVLAIQSEQLVVASLDPATGDRRWEFEFETRTGDLPPVARPAVVDGTGWLGVERNLFCFDIETGDIRWRVDLSDPVSDGRVGLTAETVWVVTGDEQATWHGYDRTDGTLRYQNPDPPLSAHILGDGTGLVASGRAALERFAVGEAE